MYTHIKNSADLKAAINLLKVKELREKEELKAEFHDLTESMKPMNLIKNTFRKVTSKPGVVGTIINTTLGLGVGILSKKLLVGNSTSIVKKLAGNAVKLGITGVIAKKSDKIKLAGLRLLTKVIGRKKAVTIM